MRKNGRTSLHLAASCGNREIVEFLINNGANINAQTSVYYYLWVFLRVFFKGGETPAMKACYFGQEEVMNDLIFRYRCDLTIANNGTINNVS